MSRALKFSKELEHVHMMSGVISDADSTNYPTGSGDGGGGGRGGYVCVCVCVC